VRSFCDGGKWFPVIFLRKLQVGMQGLDCAPVTWVGRLHLPQYAQLFSLPTTKKWDTVKHTLIENLAASCGI
jgi:hypothetical protein